MSLEGLKYSNQQTNNVSQKGMKTSMWRNSTLICLKKKNGKISEKINSTIQIKITNEHNYLAHQFSF